MTRVLTLLLSVCGVYPQYRAVRTILTGLGLLSDDSWEQNRRVNMRLGQIEPVAEGMFQLICQCIILYIVIGPAESKNDGEPILNQCQSWWLGEVQGGGGEGDVWYRLYLLRCSFLSAQHRINVH